MKLDILVFGAHPDDVELGCGGTIIKEVNRGKRVGIIDLTRGELGTRGNISIRDKETKVATNIMGVAIRENMNFKDGFFKNNDKNKLELIKKIRRYRPDIVLTNALSDRHPDHPRSSQITIDSCFLSGLEKIKTNQDIWRPKAIYHYIQFNTLSPDSNESETIISSKDFMESICYRAQDLARQSGCQYAEGFIAHQLPCIESLFDIK